VAKSKSEFASLAAEVGSQLLANRRSVLEKVDELIEASIRENRPLNYEDLDFCMNVANMDRAGINDQIRLVGRRIRAQQVAGTSKDRQELDAKVVEAAESLKVRGSELEQVIADAQKELTSLQRNSDTLTRRQSEVNQELETLTKCCSPAVRAANDAKRANLKNSLGREIGELKVTLQEIRSIIAGPDAMPSKEFYWQALLRFDRECVVQGQDGRQLRYEYSPKWQSVKAELLAEIPQRETEIAELETRFADELAALEIELQQFWR
jgi:hypothetical protein